MLLSSINWRTVKRLSGKALAGFFLSLTAGFQDLPSQYSGGFASLCFLADYLWSPIHNAFLRDTSLREIRRRWMRASSRRAGYTHHKFPRIGSDKRGDKVVAKLAGAEAVEILRINLDRTDAGYYGGLWHFLHNVLRGIEQYAVKITNAGDLSWWGECVWACVCVCDLYQSCSDHNIFAHWCLRPGPLGYQYCLFYMYWRVVCQASVRLCKR